jgi:prevent-host-death family protein
MLRASRIKTISHFRANAAKLIGELSDGGTPMILTKHGEAKAVIEDIRSYEQRQETMAFLQILALGNRNIEQGKTVPLAKAIRRLRQRLK